MNSARRIVLAGGLATLSLDRPLTALGKGVGSRLDRSRLRLVFNESFDAPLDLKWRWKPQFAHGHQAGPDADDSRTLRGNKERQIYVDPEFPGLASHPLGLDPFEVDRATHRLIITADRIKAAGKGDLWGDKYAFTSGLLTTERSFSQTFGYFEVRLQAPAGRGLWPAFWLATKDGSWPPEIDVVEILGHEPNVSYVSLHTRGMKGEQVHDVRRIVGADAARAPVTFGVLWTRDELAWFQNDIEVSRVANVAIGVGKPMILILNLAVGGIWPGEPDAQTEFPAKLVVEHVRVYRIAA